MADKLDLQQASARMRNTRTPYRQPTQGGFRETVDEATARKHAIIRFTTDHGRNNQAAEVEEDTDGSEYDEDAWPTRLPSSSRRYTALAPGTRYQVHEEEVDLQPPLSRRASAVPSRQRGQGNRNTAAPLDVIHAPPRRTTSAESSSPYPSGLSRAGSGWRPHWLVCVGLAMFIMILGWIALSAFASWWQTTQDDWRYGRPRTYQVDAVVGHNDSPANQSHFIAMNLNRHIVIIEIPGGNVSQSVVFSGPTLLGPGQDLTPVTLTFKDVNGDGNLDMVVNVQDSHFVFLNKNGTFVPAPNVTS